MRLFILFLSAMCVVLYGYALAGYGAYFFDRGRPDYIVWGLTLGTMCGAFALLIWRKWMKDTAPDLLVFDVDGVLIDTNFIGGQGLWKTGKPTILTNWKEFRLPVGIYTGRTRREMDLALKALDWCDFPEDMLICADDEILKPSPKGLMALCEKTGAKNPIYFGDMEIDRMAWKAFGKGDFVAIGQILKTESRHGEFLQFDTLEEALSSLLAMPIKTHN